MEFILNHSLIIEMINPFTADDVYTRHEGKFLMN